MLITTEKINMKELETKLAYYKMIVNSSYGHSRLITDTYYEVFKLKSKIRIVKSRKNKIKKIFNL